MCNDFDMFNASVPLRGEASLSLHARISPLFLPALPLQQKRIPALGVYRKHIYAS
jgi:hypothetical protein